MSLKVLSLFTGCGGMDIGFEGGFSCFKRSIINKEWVDRDNGDTVIVKKTSFETIFANDIRADAKAAWVNYFYTRKNLANKIYHIESIVNLVKRAKEGERVFPRKVDVVTGGFPCQDFSVSGKRLGFNSLRSHNGNKLMIDEPTVENRGHLYMWMRDVISLTNPKLFVAENVKGLMHLGDVKEIIEKDFATAGDSGYLVVPAKLLYAPNYGVPQSRERVIFFGFLKVR